MSLSKALTAAAGNAGGDNLYVEDVFSTYLYEGIYTASVTSQTITNNIDLAGEGGLVWFKNRTSAANHRLIDTERGGNLTLISNGTGGNGDLGSNGITSFNSDGWTMGTASLSFPNGNDFCSWTFRKAEKFFDVVTYTGNGVAGRTVAHNLGSTPACMIVKRTNASQGWAVYHVGMDATNPENWMMRLNATDARFDLTPSRWNDTAPTSTNFTLSDNDEVNGNGDTYVAYLFASDAGGFGDDEDESIIKCGSFAHNYSGAAVDCGFEPQWILVKAADQTTNWYIFDVMRGIVTGGLSGDGDAALFPNTAGAENVNTWGIDVNATGFTVYGNNILSSGNAIYIAIRRPMKTPESGTEVFAPSQAGGTGVDPQYPTSFPVDMAIRLYTPGLASMPRLASRLTGAKYLKTSSTDAEVSDGNSTWDYMDGWFGSDTTAADNYGLMFKRATGFFDVVAYTGNGTAGATQAHNLGVVPELMVFKNRNAVTHWPVYYGNSGKYMHLSLNDAESNSGSFWNSTSPTTSLFTVGASNQVNGSGNGMVAYLFATLAGVSKVGSYTGTGSNVDVDCGFSAGARFILIKRTDSTGDWYTYDSARGIVAGNDPYLLLNSTAAEVTSTDYIDPLSSGFTVTSSAPAALNASGGNYIFLAIA